MTANLNKIASGSVVLDLPTQSIVLRFPLLDDMGIELLERADVLAEYIKKYPEATKAIGEMEQMAVVYLEGEQEEFHIQRAHDGLLVTDHFTSYTQPAGNGLIICFTPDGCTVSNLLRDAKMALEQKLGRAINLDAIYSVAAGNQPHIHDETKCGCFACRRQFTGEEVQSFTPEIYGAKSALCPYCELDTVLSEEILPAGLSCSDELLALMNEAFFNGEVNSCAPLKRR